MRDLFLSISLSNLLFLPVWSDLLRDAPGHYGMEAAPPVGAFVAAMVCVAVASTLIFLFVSGLRRVVTRWPWVSHPFRLGLLMSIIIPLNAMRRMTPLFSVAELQAALGMQALIALVIALGLVAVYCLLRWYNTVGSGLVTGIILLVPFVVVTFGHSTWGIINYQRHQLAYEPHPPAPMAAGQPKTRILWLLFDELDEVITFDRRPKSLALPEFDRLRRQSVFATNAVSPAAWTMEAVPALLTGRNVTFAHPARSSELQLSFDGSTIRVPWSQEPNVFSRAMERNVNSGLAGWYHPYCRVVGHTLSYCRSVLWEQYDNGILSNAGRHIRTVLAAIPFTQTRLGLFGPFHKDGPEEGIRRHSLIMESALDMIRIDNLGLMVVHFSVPHWPVIYDRFSRSLSAQTTNNYLDNLILADFVLGTIRTVMESGGVWDQAVVIVSSDHGFRSHMWDPPHGEIDPAELQTLQTEFRNRVPLMIKMPNQVQGYEYVRSLSTVITHDLILGIIDESIGSPEELVAWLDQRVSLE
jgi:hypothetical protein